MFGKKPALPVPVIGKNEVAKSKAPEVTTNALALHFAAPVARPAPPVIRPLPSAVLRAAAPPPSITVPIHCSGNGAITLTTLTENAAGRFCVVKAEPAPAPAPGGVASFQLPESHQLEMGKSDWTGWRCAHCGTGRATGNRHDWLYHRECKTAFCGSKIRKNRFSEEAYCPTCQTWDVIAGVFSGSLEGAAAPANKPASNPLLGQSARATSGDAARLAAGNTKFLK